MWDKPSSQAVSSAESSSFRWLASRCRMMGAGRRLMSCDFSSSHDGRKEWIYRFETGTGRAGRITVKRSSLPFARLQTALRLRPRRALSSAEATGEIIRLYSDDKMPKALFRFCSHRPFRFCSHHDNNQFVACGSVIIVFMHKLCATPARQSAGG